ncbi:MAG: hypothetical protein LBQ12_07760 [Deltaproteobacteria bacterium]|nr:hypothetical protein [Deltaproteobacteria bacterium]
MTGYNTASLADGVAEGNCSGFPEEGESLLREAEGLKAAAVRAMRDSGMSRERTSAELKPDLSEVSGTLGGNGGTRRPSPGFPRPPRPDAGAGTRLPDTAGGR